MTIKVIRSYFHPFLTNKLGIIHNIQKKRKYFIITLLNESKPGAIYWYKTYTYLYSHRDILKITIY